MQDIHDFDILIVGAGPAGISTWLHLNKLAPELAAKAAVIDKAFFPRPKLCAGGVGGWSGAVLNDLGITLDFPLLSIEEVEFCYRDRRWVYRSPTPFRMVQRADFDTTLVNNAVRRGLVFYENEPLDKIARANGKVMGLTPRNRYHVKVIVGGDGSFSTVRRMMMPPHRTCLAPTIQLSAPVNPDHDKEYGQQRLGIDFSPVDKGLQGYIWHFPCLAGGKPIMNHGIGGAKYIPDRPKAKMKDIFIRELKKRNISGRAHAWSSYPLRWYEPDSPLSTHNVLLVGDAAGIEPAFGGGIHMALSYGEIAARALINAFKQRDFSFRHYKDELNSHFMGQYLKDCSRLAARLYGSNENPLDCVRQFFDHRDARPDLLSLLMRPKP